MVIAKGTLVAALALLGALVVSGCGADYEPPTDSPAVQQQDQKLAAIVSADQDVLFKAVPTQPQPPSSCTARYLGSATDGTSDYAWVHCATGSSEFSGPVRITDDQVTYAQDGSGYAISVRAMFPSDVADYVLNTGPVL